MHIVKILKMSQLQRGLPIITIPVKMKEQIEIAHKTQKTRQRKKIIDNIRQGDRNVPIITCKRKDFNFYKGQTYEKFAKVPLASQGWNSKKSKGDFFKIHSYGSNPAFLDYENISNDFNDLGLDKKIIEQFYTLGFKQPTNIQSLAIPHILNGSNTIVAAETGNGKTYAYIAPLIQQILRIKEQNTDDAAQFNSPKALIIVPGRELVIQIRDMTRSLGTDLGININSVVGGHTKKLLMNPRIRTPDILVASFGALSKLTTLGVYNMRSLKHIVLDEADTLLDDSFNEKMIYYLSKFPMKVTKDEELIHGASTGVQLTLVGATFPTSINRILNEIVEIESLVNVKTPLLHRVSPHIEQTFYRVGHDDRSDRLLRLVKGLHKNNTPTIIFSNTAKCSNFVGMLLNDYDIPCARMNGEMRAYDRADKFKSFQDEDCNILSCTDLASRGLNTLRVGNIINFEFPKFMSDYIHRCGRTGRVGGTKTQSQVTNFVFRPPEIELVQKIEYAVRKSEVLPNVNANIKRIMEFRRQKWEARNSAQEENT